MRSFKRIVAVVLIALCFISTIATGAFASTTNSSGSVYLSNGTGAYGTVRSKDGSTAIYLCISLAPTSHSYVGAYGYNYSNGSVKNLTYVNGAVVSYVICRTGINYSVHNTIHENGYSYACLGFTALTTASGYLSYIWSPDSSGSYIYAT